MIRTKYGAVKTVIDGIKFDSKKEAKRYQDLRLLERSGEIESLELQPRYDLIVNGVNIGFYKADFRYWRGCKQIIEDVKGMRTATYQLKKKLIAAIYGIEILET